MRKIRTKLDVGLGLLFGALLSASAQSNDTIAITVYDFPPDIINSKTEPAGPLIDKMRLIMEKADLSIQWVQSSLAEESIMLSEGSRPFCTTGRIYSDMRVKKDNWVFLPYLLHTIGGDALLAHQENLDRFNDFSHINEVFESKSLTGVFISDVSYGAQIDDVLNKYPDRFNRSAKSTDQIIAMVSNRRADYGIVTAEYWQELLKGNPQFKQLQDLSHKIKLNPNNNEELHLACSHTVASPVLARIQSAMKHLKHPISRYNIQSYSVD